MADYFEEKRRFRNDNNEIGALSDFSDFLAQHFVNNSNILMKNLKN